MDLRVYVRQQHSRLHAVAATHRSKRTLRFTCLLCAGGCVFITALVKLSSLVGEFHYLQQPLSDVLPELVIWVTGVGEG